MAADVKRTIPIPRILAIAPAALKVESLCGCLVSSTENQITGLTNSVRFQVSALVLMYTELVAPPIQKACLRAPKTYEE
jgi:hypothetical protein